MQMDFGELRWLRLTEKKEPPHWEGEESTLLQTFHVENPIVCVARVELSVQKVQIEQTHLEVQDLLALAALAALEILEALEALVILEALEALEILEALEALVILEALEALEALEHIESSRNKDAAQRAEQEQPVGHIVVVAVADVVAAAAAETECYAPSPSQKTHISEEDTPFLKC